MYYLPLNVRCKKIILNNLFFNLHLYTNLNPNSIMNNRLAQFMEAENLTSAKLAEILSVQPSNISHLLTGRNKPNFDFISKLLTLFPDLSARWLINGDGGMYINDTTLNLFSHETNVVNTQNYKCNDDKDTLEVSDVSVNSSQSDNVITYVNTQEDFTSQIEDNIDTKHSDTNRPEIPPTTTPTPVISVQDLTSEQENAPNAPSDTLHKVKDAQCNTQPSKIVVLYEDSTFEIFNHR